MGPLQREAQQLR